MSLENYYRSKIIRCIENSGSAASVTEMQQDMCRPRPTVVQLREILVQMVSEGLIREVPSKNNAPLYSLVSPASELASGSWRKTKAVWSLIPSIVGPREWA